MLSAELGMAVLQTTTKVFPAWYLVFKRFLLLR